jgi:TalC/MipB family fructose-6-phosphate aldolase
MEIWLDTIDRATIEQAKDLGLLFGVTTNPAILAEANAAAEDVLEEMLTYFSGPLAVQVTLPSAAEMIEQGKDLNDFSTRIIVKVPVTEAGIEAIYRLSHIGIPVMATAIFTPMQALLAIKAGARYLAPYFSYLKEQAFPTCLAIQRMLTPKSKLLVAALATKEQVAQCAEAGFAAVTLKASLFRECLTTPPETLEHLTRFEEAWKKAPVSNLLAAPQFIR